MIELVLIFITPAIGVVFGVVAGEWLARRVRRQ